MSALHFVEAAVSLAHYLPMSHPIASDVAEPVDGVEILVLPHGEGEFLQGVHQVGGTWQDREIKTSGNAIRTFTPSLPCFVHCILSHSALPSVTVHRAFYLA